MTAALRIEQGDWAAMAPRVTVLRTAVFVIEQGVPEALELDDHDPVSQHFAAIVPEAGVVGTARLLPDGHIGRMAVASQWRGHGIGSRLVEAIIRTARNRGLDELVLAAQLHAIPFYENLGFEASGPVFDDAGLAHRWMRRALC